ncbi:hypothetical protein MRX96_006913 [Rhipicephalus microplus]
MTPSLRSTSVRLLQPFYSVIKEEFCIVTSSQPKCFSTETATLKVTDFSLSRAFTPPVGIFTHKEGTFCYHAQERLLGCQSLLDTGGRVEYRVHLLRAADRQNSVPLGFGDRPAVPNLPRPWYITVQRPARRYAIE